MNPVLSPLTGSSKIKPLRTVTVHELVYKWQEAFAINVEAEFSGCTEITLYQCQATKLKFFEPLNSEGSENLYKKLQSFDWYYMSNKWEHQVALQDLADCKKILEIGSATGEFLQQAVNQELNIFGIELNKTAVAQGQQRGLPIEALDLRDLCTTHEHSFDGLCGFQVLEHLGNPKEFIDASLKLLKPGGKLIYCVPNSESFLKHQDNLLDMPPHHMTQWSKYTFKALEEIFPVRLEKVQFEPLTAYQISPFLRAYTSYFRSVSPAFKAVFNRVTLPVYKRALDTGFRRFFKGQSLYVQFRKLG